MRTINSLLCRAVLMAGLAWNVQAAIQYWDGSPAAGYQHGDGTWSMAAGDTNWTSAGGSAPLTTWGNTNDAWFNAFGGASTVIVNSSLTTTVVYVNGSAYSIVVTNGGRLVSTTVALGNANAANNNRFTVVGGTGVTSLWTMGTMRLGGTTTFAASNNVAVVDGQGAPESAVLTSAAMTVGASGGNAGNEMRVINAGRLYTTGATVIGSLSTGNTVRVQGAGSQWNAGGLAVTVGTGAGARRNTLLIDETGVVTNAAVVTVGTLAGSAGNQLSITNGGKLYSTGTAVIGLTASTGNTVLVSGTGSLWQVSQITVGSGSGSSGNVLRVENGGVVRCLAGQIWLGESAFCTSNQLIIQGGQVYAVAVQLGNNQFGESASVLGGAGLTSLLDCQGSTLRAVGTGGVHSILIDGAGVEGSAVASNISSITIGAAPVGRSLMTVTNAGRLFANLTLTVGNASPSNAVAIAQGSKAVVGGITMGAGSYNTLTVADPDSLLSLASSNSVIGSSAFQTGNAVLVTAGAMITNGGVLGIGTFNTNIACSLTIGSSGKVYTAGNVFLGTGIGATGNVVLVSDEGSRWDLGGKNLFIGTNHAATVNNSLTITQTGTVANIGTLTVQTNSGVFLLGGTLGVANAAVSGPFAAGDGAQAATLKSLALGTLSFSDGLTVNSNALLTGAGTVNGGEPGVLLAGGATLSPGLSGAGIVTIGGSNLTWGSGSVIRCEVTNMNAGPGEGWDLVNVSSQLVLTAAGAVIKLDSMGAAPAAWSSSSDYNLRVLTYGSLVGSAANVTVDASDFTPGGTWTLTNVNNALYLVYRGSGISYVSTSTWNDPTNGAWSVAGNWTPGGQPANDGTAALEFGGSGPAYASTNDLGAFALNKLLLTSTGGAGVTNVISGNTLVFTNADARVDYSGSARYRIDCASQFKTNVVMDGYGFGSGLVNGPAVVFTNITATGGLTKKGPWMLTLNGVNVFGGPLVMDSPADGVLRVETNAGLGTVNELIVSNGTLWSATVGASIFARQGNANRRGLITGPNSVWTNSNLGGFKVASGSTTETTNCVLTVEAGGTLYTRGPLWVGDSCPRNSLIITNGGRVFSPGASYVGGSASGVGNTAIVTGSNSVWTCGSLTIGGASGGNVLKIDQGGQYVSAGAILVQNSGATSSLIVTNGGRASCGSIQLMNLANTVGKAVITGSNSLLRLGGGNSGLVRFAGAGNIITVADGGTVTNGSWNVAYGVGAAANGVIVTNGGRMFCTGSSSLATTNGCGENFIMVSGESSLWNNGGGGLNLANGSGGASTSNWVKINDGATMTNVGTLNLATIHAGVSSNNYVLVDGGVLQAATLTCNNGQPNWVTLNGSCSVRLDNLTLTNAGQTVTLRGGALNVKNALISNGIEQVVGDGAQAAMLNFLPGGSSVFANGLVITNLATLSGSGAIQATTTVYGAFSPGAAGSGVITNNGDFTLKPGASTRIELSADTTPGAGWDLLAVTNGQLTLGGTLSVLLTGGFTPGNTQSYLIMTNQGPLSVSGSFSTGSQVTAVTNLGGNAVGYFHVSVGPQGVTLDSFDLSKVNPGTVIFIR